MFTEPNNLYVTNELQESVLAMLSLPASLHGVKILQTPGDGHCFIHAVLASWRHQQPTLKQLDHHKVGCSLFLEILHHAERYNSFREGSNTLHEMNKYIRYKAYNSEFGDLVPFVLSNALNINVKILEKFPSGEVRTSFTRDLSVSPSCPTVVVYKEHEHYSAVSFQFAADLSSCVYQVPVNHYPEKAASKVYNNICQLPPQWQSDPGMKKPSILVATKQVVS